MPVSIVVGGQYGSEGKGKVTYYFANKLNAKAVVRVGGPNSGHTVVHDGKTYKLRVLSAASMLPNVLTVLPAGSFININLLNNELDMLKEFNVSDRLVIDENAMVLDNVDLKAEVNSNLEETIGSTVTGTGSALTRRIGRNINEKITLACEEKSLAKYVVDVNAIYNKLLSTGKHIIVEGTQGFGLSMLHSKHWPFCTARDTTAQAFLMEAGISPMYIENVIMVIRRYPIRVGGNSGYLEKEITWEEVTANSGTNKEIKEYTTVTNRLRRVGEFDEELVKRAILVNNPNIIVMNHEDYMDYSNTGNNKLTDKQIVDLKDIECKIGRKINYVGNGSDRIITF